jgi:hypothetical protein
VFPGAEAGTERTHLERLSRDEGFWMAEAHGFGDGRHAEQADGPAEVTNGKVAGVCRKLNRPDAGARRSRPAPAPPTGRLSQHPAQR